MICVIHVNEIAVKISTNKKAMTTYPASSFCSLVIGLTEPPPVDGNGCVETPPPPPRNGLAMRPKFKGVEVTAFCARRISRQIWIPTFFEYKKKKKLTSGLI